MAALSADVIGPAMEEKLNNSHDRVVCMVSDRWYIMVMTSWQRIILPPHNFDHPSH
jgi:hypothetical protein